MLYFHFKMQNLLENEENVFSYKIIILQWFQFHFATGNISYNEHEIKKKSKRNV